MSIKLSFLFFCLFFVEDQFGVGCGVLEEKIYTKQSLILACTFAVCFSSTSS